MQPGKQYHYRRYAEQAGRVAARRACRQSAEFRDRYRWRAGMEGAMSGYDRRTGVKRLRVRGLKAVRLCAALKAVGVNLFRTGRCAGPKAGPATPSRGPQGAYLGYFLVSKSKLSRWEP